MIAPKNDKNNWNKAQLYEALSKDYKTAKSTYHVKD